LPDISKINALDIGSVSKVDGLAKASILDINGLTVPSGVAPPLDTYTGASAAFSVRLLRTAYTGDIMRVRRDSDNVEADVGFDSNNEFGLTSPVSNPSSGGPFTDFADFIGHGGTPANGFVRWWYDQSGNAVDAGQATSGNQPKIYDSGTGIIEEGSTGNEKPIIESLANAYLQSAYDGNAIFFSVAAPINGCILGHYDLTSGGGSNSNGWLYMAEAAYGGNAFGSDITINSARKNGSAYSTTGAAADDIYTDFVGQNLLYTSLSTASQNLNFGYRPAPAVFPMWSMQEFIIYPDTSTHTPSDIEDNINAFFQIY